jgi:hypothetical protein
MTGYYLVLDKLRAELLSNVFVSNVTHGLGDEIDLNKQTIFPLSHIDIISATPCRIFCRDICYGYCRYWRYQLR